MTHTIQQWHKSGHVHALQTSNTLIDEAFDIHPNHSDPQQMTQLASIFALPHQPKFVKQVHGSKVIEYENMPSKDFNTEADACFTRAPGVICSVLTADCLPVLMTDTNGTFVAAIHCGWRSLYANILSATINIINPSHEINVWFGPCIQPSQYEVDEEFVNNYLSKHPYAAEAFSPISNLKSFANLYQLAEMQLNNMGINNISKANECTHTDPRYYSWRENQTPKRNATLIWMSPA
jgi:YfiH family protein